MRAYDITISWMSEGEMDHSSDMNSEDEMGRRDLRRVYLITYSQADVERFPTKNSFAVAVLVAFSRTNSKVIQWCCFRWKITRHLVSTITCA